MEAREDSQQPVQAPSPERIRAEAERLAADTSRMRSRLGPADAPDLRDTLNDIVADAQR
jgi:hypothetical protein